jgi:hypothetical protein
LITRSTGITTIFGRQGGDEPFLPSFLRLAAPFWPCGLDSRHLLRILQLLPFPHRHCGAGRNPVAWPQVFAGPYKGVPAIATALRYRYWIPACAGMTVKGLGVWTRF